VVPELSMAKDASRRPVLRRTILDRLRSEALQRAPRIPESDPRVNALLGHLPPDEWAALRGSAQIVTIDLEQVLFSDDEPGDVVYFPLTAIVSMMALMRDGQEIEYGSIGREGMVGLQVALRAQPLRGRAMCQLEGEAVCFRGADLRKIMFAAGPELQRLLLRYAQSTINVLAQSTACNALHSVRERTARWLLMTRDRAGEDTFDLTQEFLSKMLGVRRAGVAEVARELQRDGIIEYIRAQIRVCDPTRLESTACECYALIRDEYARVLDTVRA
jgi:CRP-like cAMP-binding protein